MSRVSPPPPQLFSDASLSLTCAVSRCCGVTAARKASLTGVFFFLFCSHPHFPFFPTCHTRPILPLSLRDVSFVFLSRDPVFPYGTRQFLFRTSHRHLHLSLSLSHQVPHALTWQRSARSGDGLSHRSDDTSDERSSYKSRHGFSDCRRPFLFAAAAHDSGVFHLLHMNSSGGVGAAQVTRSRD